VGFKIMHSENQNPDLINQITLIQNLCACSLLNSGDRLLFEWNQDTVIRT